jgi:hypothetical protein
LSENHAVYEDEEKYGAAGQATDGAYALHARYLRLQTNSEYAILIAFPRQQWLGEGIAVIRYAYISSLVFGIFRAKSLCFLCGFGSVETKEKCIRGVGRRERPQAV